MLRVIGQKLEVRQGQGLVITPQLQQAIKLLQLSNLELEAYVEAELERNPLLARAETEIPSEEAPALSPPAEAELSFQDPSAPEAALDVPADALYDAAPGEQNEVRDDSQPGLTDWSRASHGGGSFDHDGDFERPDEHQPTLIEHLQGQAVLAGFTPAEHAVALSLIDCVDEAGYLRADLAEMAERLNTGTDMMERVLRRCQGFEPAGVMARSVAECLRLQLEDRNRFDPAMAALLDNLDLMARRDLPALRKVCGVDHEDLVEMIAEIRGLTPRPGAGFGSAPAQTIVPDVFVRPDPAGGWKVELNSDTLPRLLMDKRYHAQISGSARSEADKSFVADCASQASWLVKSLDQRARTILKVASEIVRQQDAFMAFGVEFLRPLTLKMVAEAIEMHESTVSRVTSNKYIATPRGVFEMKFFFTAAIQSSDGGALHSAEAVRHRIKALIDAEDVTGEILSDDRIVEILQEAGIDIARRTVAKYREALRIPSSVERRRLRRAA